MTLKASQDSGKEAYGRLWRFGKCEFDEFSRELRANGRRAYSETIAS